jgi:hypothetical protein
MSKGWTGGQVDSWMDELLIKDKVEQPKQSTTDGNQTR